MNKYLSKVIEIVGSQAELARQLKVAPSYVHKMVNSGHVPVEQCRKIEAIVHGEVTAEQLRPDVYAPVDYSKASPAA